MVFAHLENVKEQSYLSLSIENSRLVAESCPVCFGFKVLLVYQFQCAYDKQPMKECRQLVPAAVYRDTVVLGERRPRQASAIPSIIIQTFQTYLFEKVTLCKRSVHCSPGQPKVFTSKICLALARVSIVSTVINTYYFFLFKLNMTLEVWCFS